MTLTDVQVGFPPRLSPFPTATMSSLARPLTRAALRHPASTKNASFQARLASTSTVAGSSTSGFRTFVSVATLVATGTVATVYYLDSRSALHRYGVMPLVRSTMDPEAGHKFAVKALASGFAPRDLQEDSEQLEAEVGHENTLSSF